MPSFAILVSAVLARRQTLSIGLLTKNDFVNDPDLVPDLDPGSTCPLFDH